MKNIFRVALLTALACLLCFSCTNINDPEALTADKFTVNKMKVEGFYVEGLADDYDQKTVQLMYAVKDKDNKEQSTLIAEAIVGGKDESTVPGKAYVKLAEPKIVEGNGTYYLKFKDDDKTKVQVLNKKMAYENADVGMLSSPYGTKDDALISKFMVVKATPVAGEGIPATFAWDDAKNVKEPEERVFHLAGMVFKGGWDDWWQDAHVLTDEEEQEYTLKMVDKVPTGKEWGIFPEGLGNQFNIENVKFGERTKLTLNPGSNSTMETNWEEGVTYKAKIEFVSNDYTDPEIYITISKVTE